jgi:lysozyme
MTITCAADLIRAAEGLRLQSYDDATGLPVNAGDHCTGTLTIGWGHTGPDVYPGQIITVADAERLFEVDVLRATRDAILVVGSNCWLALNAARRAVVTDMVFEMGMGGVEAFKLMIHCIQAHDWKNASAQALASKWAKQVPSRARRNAAILLSGEWPGAKVIPAKSPNKTNILA